MGKFALAGQDSRIRDHIKAGGSTTDKVGRELIGRFCVMAMQNIQVADACHRYGFDLGDLVIIYCSMVDCLRPNPCIEMGTIAVTASMPFLEPWRIEMMLSVMCRHLRADMTPVERASVIMHDAAVNAKIIWDAHTVARGEANFKIGPQGSPAAHAGCGAVVALAIGVLSAVAWAICVLSTRV